MHFHVTSASNLAIILIAIPIILDEDISCSRLSNHNDIMPVTSVASGSLTITNWCSMLGFNIVPVIIPCNLVKAS